MARFTVLGTFERDDLARILPPEYRTLARMIAVPHILYTVIQFDHDRRNVVSSSAVARALAAVTIEQPLLVVGGNFTSDALALLEERGARVVRLGQFHWTDSDVHSLQGGRPRMIAWLADFVAAKAEAQRSADPRLAAVLAAAGGMRIIGTMGGEVFLRPDGTTVALIEGPPGEQDWWRELVNGDRIATIVASLNRFPELRGLLPQRRAASPPCAACSGTGRVHGFVCGTCNGLGWIDDRQPNDR